MCAYTCTHVCIYTVYICMYMYMPKIDIVVCPDVISELRMQLRASIGVLSSAQSHNLTISDHLRIYVVCSVFSPSLSLSLSLSLASHNHSNSKQIKVEPSITRRYHSLLGEVGGDPTVL